jgi:glutathione synthase/RimK-type ligase-like ATP-grasp enzyme
MYDEGDIITEPIPERLIFSMVQGPAGSAALMDTAASGALIINSPDSVMNCYRVKMIKLLPHGGIPFPKSVIVETRSAMNGLPTEFMSHKVWVKRGDVHAVHKEDVTLAYTDEEKITILKEFHRRGIERAILQEHITGDTVKFYALRDSEFFYWYFLNGVYHTSFAQQQLYELAQASAQALGLFVFGGDAIIGPDGAITIIDINDWPSFAPIRDAASRHIGQLLYRKAEDYVREHH